MKVLVLLLTWKKANKEDGQEIAFLSIHETISEDEESEGNNKEDNMVSIDEIEEEKEDSGEQFDFNPENYNKFLRV